jgi:hypothetical protein
MELKPVTGGASRFPMFDRNHKRLHVGDKIRAQICVGRYGQTKIVETTVDQEHYPYCTIHAGNQPISFHYGRGELIGYYENIDYEHAHKAWVEIID